MKFSNLPFTCQIGKYGYNHQALIGSGIYSKVYVGKNIEQPGEALVLKVIENSLVSSPSLHQRVVDEVAVLKKLASKNLVKLVDILVTKHRTIIVQEFCSDGSLADILKKVQIETKLTENDARKILQDICKGLQELVKINILHRDLKPENILCHKLSTGEKLFKISDFSVSKQVTDFNNDQMLKTLCGTPLYNSPQILKQMEYSIKSDIWSLGLIYYQMLFGKLPWTPKNHQDLIQQIETFPVTFPSTISISQESRDFILGCLQIDESKRLNWGDIFSHPVLKLNSQQLSKPISLSEKCQEVIANLQNVIAVNKIDIEQLFQSLDTTKKSYLNLEEFSKLLLKLDKNLEYEVAKAIFIKFDMNKDNQLSFAEFKMFILGNDYSPKKIEQNSVYIKYQADLIVKQVADMINNYCIDIESLFKAYDVNNDQFFSLDEFHHFLTDIDEKITLDTSKLLFQKFDSNSDGKISLTEFKTYLEDLLSKVPGHSTKKQIAKEPLQLQKLLSPLQQLSPTIEKSLIDMKQMVIKNKIDIKQIFKTIDTNKTGFLSFEQLQYFAKVINARLLENEIQQIFNAFDVNKDGKLQFSEFSSIFQ